MGEIIEIEWHAWSKAKEQEKSKPYRTIKNKPENPKSWKTVKAENPKKIFIINTPTLSHFHTYTLVNHPFQTLKNTILEKNTYSDEKKLPNYFFISENMRTFAPS